MDLQNFNYKKLCFPIVFIIIISIIIYSSLRTINELKKTYGVNRKEIALKVFMDSQYHPEFYSKFGKFPTQFKNTLYKDYKIMDLTLKDFYVASAFRPYQVAGDTYDMLKKCITINIVDFKCSDIKKLHTVYHLYESRRR